MAKNRLRVRQIWTGWADKIANRVVYGAFGRSGRRVKLENRPAHRFLRTRRRWNQYVNWLQAHEQITEQRAGQMCRCHYQGVTLNIDAPKLACHDGHLPVLLLPLVDDLLETEQVVGAVATAGRRHLDGGRTRRYHSRPL